MVYFLVITLNPNDFFSQRHNLFLLDSKLSYLYRPILSFLLRDLSVYSPILP